MFGLPSALFSLLQAYEVLEPFGPLMDGFHAGQVAATVYNMNRSEKAPHLTASAFIPALAAELRAEPEPEDDAPLDMTPEEQAAALDVLFGFK